MIWNPLFLETPRCFSFSHLVGYVFSERLEGNLFPKRRKATHDMRTQGVKPKKRVVEDVGTMKKPIEALSFSGGFCGNYPFDFCTKQNMKKSSITQKDSRKQRTGTVNMVFLFYMFYIVWWEVWLLKMNKITWALYSNRVGGSFDLVFLGTDSMFFSRRHDFSLCVYLSLSLQPWKTRPIL